MHQRLLVSFLGLIVVVGLLGMGQTGKRARRSPADEPAAGPQAATADQAGSTEKKDQPREGSKDAGDTKPAAAKRKKIETATFGGGCFWCMEAVFERIAGVKSVVSGYSGGHIPNPSYEQVCTGLTGHAEVIQIEYDPEVLPFGKLLKYFWIAHDPTTLNSQGPDFGTQYRSIILVHDEEQKEEAVKQLKEHNAQRSRRSPIVTEIVPFEAFYPADAYHQDYYRNHPDADYSQAYIEPKVRKLRQKLKQEAAAAATESRSGKAGTH